LSATRVCRHGCRPLPATRPVVFTKAAATESQELDVEALAKYGGAVSLQTGIMTGTLFGLQQITSAVSGEVGVLTLISNIYGPDLRCICDRPQLSRETC